jgi:hypothetical protein
MHSLKIYQTSRGDNGRSETFCRQGFRGLLYSSAELPPLAFVRQTMNFRLNLYVSGRLPKVSRTTHAKMNVSLETLKKLATFEISTG